MGLMAKDRGDGQTFDPIPEKIHHGICVAVLDMGTQYNETWDKHIHQVLITWELPDERIMIQRDGGEIEDKPRWISKFFTLSLHEKANLRKVLESWRGKSFTKTELEGFDLKNLLTVNCMLQVIHAHKDNKTYANVNAVMPLMGYEKKEAENPYLYFSFEEGFDLPEGVPDWITEIIQQSEEWDLHVNPRPQGDVDREGDSDYVPPPIDDDIPF